MGDSVHPDVQNLDAQDGLDTWIMEIHAYLKDTILLVEHASAERMIHVAK
jgi:hypothetical protein